MAKDQYGFDTQLKPYPASSSIPDWWKNESPYIKSPINPNGSKIILRNGVSNATFKKCTPMLDALISGYIIPLWADVQVTLENKDTSNIVPIITSRTARSVFEKHGQSSQNVENPPGYLNFVVKYVNTWIPITPKGYSCLITSPFGYRNLPFQAIPSIIDTDKSTLDVSVPMWVSNSFEGIVEKGTPLLQITPFKRESWESSFEYFKDDDHMKILDKTFNSTIVNHYIKNVWSKKSYK